MSLPSIKWTLSWHNCQVVPYPCHADQGQGYFMHCSCKHIISTSRMSSKYFGGWSMHTLCDDQFFYFAGIGYAMCCLSLYIGTYYNIILSWAFFYIFSSFTTNLPWASCGNWWNTEGEKKSKSKFNNMKNLSLSSMQKIWLKELYISWRNYGQRGWLCFCKGCNYWCLEETEWNGDQCKNAIRWIFSVSLLLVFNAQTMTFSLQLLHAGHI